MVANRFGGINGSVEVGDGVELRVGRRGRGRRRSRIFDLQGYARSEVRALLGA